ncbi:MAG: hypothetical protein LAT75_07075 [Candidatus Cyclonatronum sp.]|uniref:hypothetical protein n=1 Tax=Cyclonatronum sp. TaxID=3024185 RepID=UPI0025BBF578|nr:hypothetical protein [Cyclonatronum sp.]MCC5932911.1 hypothetical protein [Balneolales bacterium]MCH8486610.1 hypothetical protein [Cyclonatronum sp.]
MNTNELFSRLTNDAAYLIDEAQALMLVIDVVPVAEKRGGIESMLDMIYLIDHAQQTYYRPLIEKIFSLPDPNAATQDFRKTVDYDAQLHESPAAVLKSIIENRRSFVDYLKAIGQDHILKTGIINSEEQSIAGLLQEMIAFERQQLKLVAERVLSIDRSKQEQGKPGL